MSVVVQNTVASPANVRVNGSVRTVSSIPVGIRCWNLDLNSAFTTSGTANTPVDSFSAAVGGGAYFIAGQYRVYLSLTLSTTDVAACAIALSNSSSSDAVNFVSSGTYPALTMFGSNASVTSSPYAQVTNIGGALTVTLDFMWISNGGTVYWHVVHASSMTNVAINVLATAVCVPTA